MLKGAEVEALPLRVPPPVFVTVKVRSAELPTATLPKSSELGVTEMAGTGNAASIVPRLSVLVLKYVTQAERKVSSLVTSPLGAVVPSGIRRTNACLQVVVVLTPVRPLLGERVPSQVWIWLSVTFCRVPLTVTPVCGVLELVLPPVLNGLFMKKKLGTSAAVRRPIMY